MQTKLQLVGVAIATCVSFAHAQPQPYIPEKWKEFVKVEGQPLAVPRQWLPDEEARIAHNLKLPPAVPQPTVFDFGAAWRKSWLPGTPRVAVQYFNHLCQGEAGEWIFKKVQNVEGLYFARPQKAPTTDVMTDPYGPEMPWIQRIFMLQGDNPLHQGNWFIQPPLYNYRFVEQPRRDVDWQAHFVDSYVRLFGYTREFFVKPGQVVAAWNERSPMQVIEIGAPAARYGYTWRGLRRERDREFGIAGGEVIIYDLRTREVLAVRRQFLIASKNSRGEGKAMWELAAPCAKLPSNGLGGEFTQFAFDTLQTIEPSKTGDK